MKEGGKKRGGVGLDFQKRERESVAVAVAVATVCAVVAAGGRVYLLRIQSRRGSNYTLTPPPFNHARGEERESGGEKENFFSEVGGGKGGKVYMLQKENSEGKIRSGVFSHASISPPRCCPEASLDSLFILGRRCGSFLIPLGEKRREREEAL